MIFDTTIAYRRHLPHLRRPEAMYFVTFCTFRRAALKPGSRDIALSCCIYEHLKTSWLECVVLMPDHVHLILAPFFDWSLERVIARVKSVSARRINEERLTKGHVWQHESFDHILRSHEEDRKKALYVCENPVRAGLARSPDEYPWIWRSWIEGKH